MNSAAISQGLSIQHGMSIVTPRLWRRGCSIQTLVRIEQILRRLGINDDSDIVIYSNPFDNWGDEGRMFWMLEYLGHPRLRILDGGWVKWTAEKRPFEHGPVSATKGNFTARPVQALMMVKDDLKTDREDASSPDGDSGCSER